MDWGLDIVYVNVSLKKCYYMCLKLKEIVSFALSQLEKQVRECQGNISEKS